MPFIWVDQKSNISTSLHILFTFSRDHSTKTSIWYGPNLTDIDGVWTAPFSTTGFFSRNDGDDYFIEFAWPTQITQGELSATIDSHFRHLNLETFDGPTKKMKEGETIDIQDGTSHSSLVLPFELSRSEKFGGSFGYPKDLQLNFSIPLQGEFEVRKPIALSRILRVHASNSKG